MIFFMNYKNERTVQVLNADQLAEILQVNRQRIYELARTRRIPVIVLGERQYRFSQQAVFQKLGIQLEELPSSENRD